jgi:uncharacterized protein
MREEMEVQETIQWRSWSAEAFHQARDLEKPIFLSVSAVWCHWCHVMDEESFSHPEVIRRINADFIPIRVDSDKRPDINNRYNMGGWPTVAVLNKDGKVMAGATYLPIGQLLTMLSSVKREPKGTRQAPSETAVETDRRDDPGRTQGAASTIELDDSLVQTVAGFLERAFDPHFGGFGGPPKFPQPWAVELAFHLNIRTGEKKWLEMAKLTLDNMREGGIYDAVDGGFFRYATRGDWDNPHSEKLLETNTRMLSLYLKAYDLTGQTSYRTTAEGILNYLFVALAISGKAWFCGSQSADQDYYALPETERLEAEVPPLDQTIYTDRNAMAASAFLSAYHTLGDIKYLDAALKLIDFLWTHFYESGLGMFHYDDGKLTLLGYLSDQVYMMLALMDAYEATGRGSYLSWAEDLAEMMDRHLWDKEEAGCWDLPTGQAGLPDDSEALGVLKVRIKPFVENAVAAMAFIRLYHLTGRKSYHRRADAALRYLSSVFTAYKHHAAPFAVAVERFLKPPLLVTIVGKREEARWMELLFAAHRLRSLWKVVLPLDAEQDRKRLILLGYPQSDQPLAYVCIGKTCFPPVSRPEDLARLTELDPMPPAF